MNNFLLTPFNGLFFLILAVFTSILVASAILLKNKDMKVRRIVLMCAMIFTLITFIFYKTALYHDHEYNIIRIENDLGGFNVWTEFPLHLCNINMLLIPVAALTMKRPILGFCFFTGPIGAFLALIMPSTGFSGYSILLPRMLGYYFTHFMVLFCGIAVAAFGLYRPEFSDIIPTFIAMLCVTLFAFTVSMTLRLTGLAEHANYFYSIDPEGNPILELFHKFIPLPFLYLLPGSLILFPYLLIVTSGFYIAENHRHLHSKSDKILKTGK